MNNNIRNIKLLISYDGTDYIGWQRQREIIPHLHSKKHNRTIQGVIEDALKKMHSSHVNLTGSGRTDSGVHAAGQAANFYTGINSIPADRFTPALNTLLPKDVRILDSCEVDNGFHARYNACSRTYRYQFICCRPVMPYERRYNLYLSRFPCLKTLNAYGRLLSGETDCTIFAGAGDVSKSNNRYIYNACFFMEQDRLIFEICANAFLRKMVRSIAGTFLYYEKKDTPPDKLCGIISSGKRSLAGPSLPPQGLYLWKVEY